MIQNVNNSTLYNEVAVAGPGSRGENSEILGLALEYLSDKRPSVSVLNGQTNHYVYQKYVCVVIKPKTFDKEWLYEKRTAIFIDSFTMF